MMTPIRCLTLDLSVCAGQDPCRPDEDDRRQVLLNESWKDSQSSTVESVRTYIRAAFRTRHRVHRPVRAIQWRDCGEISKPV